MAGRGETSPMAMTINATLQISTPDEAPSSRLIPHDIEICYKSDSRSSNVRLRQWPMVDICGAHLVYDLYHHQIRLLSWSHADSGHILKVEAKHTIRPIFKPGSSKSASDREQSFSNIRNFCSLPSKELGERTIMRIEIPTKYDDLDQNREYIEQIKTFLESTSHVDTKSSDIHKNDGNRTVDTGSAMWLNFKSEGCSKYERSPVSSNPSPQRNMKKGSMGKTARKAQAAFERTRYSPAQSNESAKTQRGQTGMRNWQQSANTSPRSVRRHLNTLQNLNETLGFTRFDINSYWQQEIEKRDKEDRMRNLEINDTARQSTTASPKIVPEAPRPPKPESRNDQSDVAQLNTAKFAEQWYSTSKTGKKRGGALFDSL